MRPSNKSRSRNKPGNNGHSNGGGSSNSNMNNSGPRRSMGNIVNRVFESAGPDGKVRGTPQQIIDKYQALARDAQVSGDRVAAENYLQHSEHYSRLLGEAQRSQGDQQQRFSPERDDQQRFGQERDDQQLPRSDEAPATQRQQPPMSQPGLSSGLTTIDPEDSDYFGGPIETPENSRRIPEPVIAQPAPAPIFEAPAQEPYVVQPEFAPLRAPDPAPVQDQAAPSPEPAAAAPAKRPRVRRKAKVDPEPDSEPEAGVSDQPVEQI